MGLFLTALGGFGAFHFGHRLERTQEKERVVLVQELSDAVSTLREEQRGIRERVSPVEEKVGEPQSSQVAALADPAAPVDLPATPPPSMAPALLPLTPSVPASPHLPLPDLPAIAQGPPSSEEEETPPPSLKPPKLESAAVGKEIRSQRSKVSAPKPPNLESASVPPQASVAVAESDEASLNGDKRTQLVERLRGQARGDFVVRAAADSARAVKLAITLKSVFREAGWGVSEIEMVTRPLPTHSLLMTTGTFPPPKEFVAAYAALARSGFLVTSDLDPAQSPKRVVVSVGPIP
jgi:hypothetical protein